MADILCKYCNNINNYYILKKNIFLISVETSWNLLKYNERYHRRNSLQTVNNFNFGWSEFNFSIRTLFIIKTVRAKYKMTALMKKYMIQIA